MKNPRSRDFVKAPWRFWAHVSRTDGCWEWQGTLSRHGYGVIAHCGRQWKAHRLSYLLTHGELSDEAWICHTCDNPRCVRPDHLYAGTATDNNRDTVKRGRYRNQNTQKTHCKRGHELTPENTWQAYKRAGEATARRCRICTLALNAASRARHGKNLTTATKELVAILKSA